MCMYNNMHKYTHRYRVLYVYIYKTPKTRHTHTYTHTPSDVFIICVAVNNCRILVEIYISYNIIYLYNTPGYRNWTRVHLARCVKYTATVRMSLISYNARTRYVVLSSYTGNEDIVDPRPRISSTLVVLPSSEPRKTSGLSVVESKLFSLSCFCSTYNNFLALSTNSS